MSDKLLKKIFDQFRFIKGLPVTDIIVIVSITAFTLRRLMFVELPGPGDNALNTYLLISFLARSFSEYNGFFVWNPYAYNGYPAPLYLRPVYILYGALALIFGVINAVKILIITTFLLAGFSMYLFTYHFTKSRIASLTAALVYTFNQNFLYRSRGQYVITIGFALAPLVFLAFEKALESDSRKNCLLTGIVLAIFLSSHPHPIFIFMLFFPLYVSFFLFFGRINSSDGKKLSKRVKRVVKVSVISGMICLMLSAYWILPLFLVKPDLLGVNFNFQQSYRFSPTFTDAIILKNPRRPLEHPLFSSLPYSLLLYGIPLLAFSAIVICRNRYTVSLTALAVLSVFLAKGPHEPLPQVFSWLWNHLIYFSTLRSAHRFLMIASLSYAFLSGVTLHTISSKISLLIKRHHGGSKKIHKIITTALPSALNCLMVVSIIILIFAGSWVGMVEQIGKPIYSPSDVYSEPSKWVSLQPGDFRVASIPVRSFKLLEGKEFEGSGRGRTYGKATALVHDKEAFNGGEWWSSPTYTMEFMRLLDRTISKGVNVGKLFAIANVRYIILDPEITIETQNFLLKQTSMKEVYRHGNTSVLENLYWYQHVFGSANTALVFGGRSILTSLSDIEGFNFTKLALIFGEQPYGSPYASNSNNEHDAIIFYGFNVLDFTFLTYGKKFLINAESYAFPGSDSRSQWVRSTSWYKEGYFVINKYTLTTRGNTTVTIPFRVWENDAYDIWIRIAYGKKSLTSGNLSVSIQGINPIYHYSPIPQFESAYIESAEDVTVNTKSPYTTFKWVRLMTVNLNPGDHQLLLNNKNGANSVDQIAVIPSSTFQVFLDTTLSYLQNSQERLIFLLKRDKAFKLTKAGKTSINMLIPRASRYMIALHFASNRTGKLKLAVDDQKFQINHTDPEKIVWYLIGPVFLETGNHTLTFKSAPGANLDKIILFSLKEGENPSSLSDIFSTYGTTQIDYTMINPSEYVVHVNTTKPFVLVFSESYHKLWRAYVDNREIQPILAYSFINGFYIDKIGEYDVTIKFTGQRYLTIGSIISSLSFGIVITYSFFPTLIKIRRSLRARKIIEVLTRRRYKNPS